VKRDRRDQPEVEFQFLDFADFDVDFAGQIPGVRSRDDDNRDNTGNERA
jgi:hypothetical protein